MLDYLMLIRGTSLSRAWFLGGQAQKGNPLGIRSGRLLLPKGQTLWGCFPQMAPLILGLLGFAGSIPRCARIYSLLITSSIPVSLYRFLPIFLTFLGEYSYTTISLYDHCFFFRNRPLEESPHRSCRAVRGEVDSSIPRVPGGL